MTSLLTWLHIGDLHLKEPGAENERDYRRIAAAVRALPPGSIDFVFLPGDNADNGTAAQYAMVRDGLAGMSVPVHVITGDHDVEPGSLDAFYATLGVPRLPYAATARGLRCLFLDLVSAGSGGPDFRIDAGQLGWAEAEVAAAEAAGETVAVFMHTYPADLREGQERLRTLLARPSVLSVDMGHTHYNELANDGGTVFMATRSTGQIEEGPAGFSVAALHERAVSWRFKPLDACWPFVLITRPADRRLTGHGGAAADPTVWAKVLGDAPIRSVRVAFDGGTPEPMTPVAGDTGLWRAPGRAAARIEVSAEDERGRTDRDVVEPAPAHWQPPPRAADGSDADRIEPWPEKGIVGGQLGPNRNGREW